MRSAKVIREDNTKSLASTKADLENLTKPISENNTKTINTATIDKRRIRFIL